MRNAITNPMMFFAPATPNSLEVGTYNRHASNTGPFFWTTNAFIWKWGVSGTLVTFPRARMVVDGVPGAWVTPTSNSYAFAMNVANGYHFAQPEVDAPDVTTLGKPFVVNTTAAPLPNPVPWAAVVRHELVQSDEGVYGAKQFTYPPREAKRYPLKSRTFEPLASVVPTSQLWVRRITDSYKGPMMRYYVSLPTGDVAIESSNKYFYTDATSTAGFPTGISAPRVMHRDGPRGVGTFGFTYKMIGRDNHRGVYGSDTNGRVWFLFTSKARDVPPGFDPSTFAFNGDVGEVVTLAGWTNKGNTLPCHNGVKEIQYMHNKSSALYRAGDAQYFEDSHEHRGDWSQVRGIKFFHEVWGIAVARRMPDGTINSRDGMEVWAADTLNHRILFINAWPMHPPFFNPLASFPPVGYVNASGFTGESSVGVFLDGNGNSTPTAFLNEPWDCEVHEARGKLVWSNFAGDSICMANLDGTGAEKLAGGPPLINAQLGIDTRLGDAQLPGMTAQQTTTYLRATFSADGAAAVARLVRPQGIAVDENGDVVWYERYTFAVRRFRMATRTVETVWQMPVAQIQTAASGVNDSMLLIDTTGVFGAKGDIFIRPWRNQTAYRITRDGVSREKFFSNSGYYSSNGPGNIVDAVDYSWGMALCRTDGTFYLSGNAGASQFFEVSKRQPGDGPDRDVARYNRGRIAWRMEGPPFMLTHGPDGQGRLGYETVEELGAFDDTRLRAYLVGYGATSVDDLVYFIREATRDFDYYIAPTTEDPAMIAELQQALTAAQASLTQAQSELTNVSAQLAAETARANAAEAKLSTARTALAPLTQALA